MNNPEDIHIPSPLHEAFISEASGKSIRIFFKRDDQIHLVISGNKWRKLKYNLIQAREQGHHTLLTYGGAWSNHIHAVARTGKLFGFKTVGVIRGEQPGQPSTTLSSAMEQDMHLHFIPRSIYRNKDNPELRQQLESKFGRFYEIPEGGANEEGVKGCEEIISEIDIDFHYVCTPCGTGTTLAGLVRSCLAHQHCIGFSALKDGSFLANDIKTYLPDRHASFDIISDYSFGGYAKTSPLLEEFILNFYKKHNIMLDPVYTGKMVYGIQDLLVKGHFKNGSTIVILHTGGLQGIAGYPDLHKALFTKED